MKQEFTHFSNGRLNLQQQPGIELAYDGSSAQHISSFGRVVDADSNTGTSSIPLASVLVPGAPGGGANEPPPLPPPSYFDGIFGSSPSPANPGANKQLNELKSLYDQGVLTNEQYTAAVVKLTSKK